MLPLDTWRETIGYHPLHFWQLANSDVPVSSNCNSLVYEYAWQNADAAGRSEIRRAITVAEARLREYLNYSVGRRWIVETLAYPRPRGYGRQYAASISSEGRWLNIRLSEGYVRALGVETRETLDAAAAVTYSDPDGDGLDEAWTVTIANVTTVTDVDQVAVYFGASDRLNGEAVGERWRIAPVQASLSGTTLTIRGKSWLLVKPIKYEGFGRVTLDPADAGSFVTTVAVYRQYTDPDGLTTDTAQAVLIWETEPYPAFCSVSDAGLTFSPNSADPAALAYAVARAQIRDARLGEITVGRATYDNDSGQWASVDWSTYRQPDRVLVRYEAGAELSAMENTLNQTRIPGRWDEVVTRLAAAELAERICACDTANRELYRWQFDLSRAAGANDEQYRISDADLSNPFGTRAGAVYAWKRVRNLQIVQAFLPG